jgi:hypothetical protein
MSKLRLKYNRKTIQLRDLAKHGRVSLETFAKEVTQELAEEVIKRTPVDTGFLRGSWFSALNTATGFFSGAADKGGRTTAGQVKLKISQLKIGDTVYVLNGARYAAIVETGTSKQAPNGFVRTTVNDARAIAERVARRLAKR